MAYTTFSQTKNDQLKEPMFFGQPVNVARYDQQKYDIFEKLIEKQLSFFWRPEEVDVSRDRIDYQSLPDHVLRDDPLPLLHPHHPQHRERSGGGV